MKRNLSRFFLQRIPGAAFLTALLAFPLSAGAGTVNLATVPLASATTTQVLPNLMYIQDNSGSMNWDYIPDKIVDGNYCKGGGTGTTYRCCRNNNGSAIGTNSEEDVCNPRESASTYRGMPPFVTHTFNRIYYNPALTYTPPKDASGNPKAPSSAFSENSWGAVPYDGYDVQDNLTINGNNPVRTVNLPTGYPDVEWCTDNSYTDCLRNDNYILPAVVNNKNYNVQHAVTVSQGTSQFATGPVANPTTLTRSSRGPFYYVVVPGEYCTTPELTSCATQNAPSTSNPYPAYLRWCNSAALTTCQATGDSSYRYPRYPTIVTGGGAGAESVGRIQFSNVPRANVTPTNATCSNVSTATKVVITDITLNGQSVLATKPFTYCSRDGDQDDRNRGLQDAIVAALGNGFSGVRINDNTDNKIDITTPAGTSYNGATLGGTLTNVTLSLVSAFAGGQAATPLTAVPGEFRRIDIVTGDTYGDLVDGNGVKIIDRSKRSDCTNGVCTGVQEMQNFANWVAWYRSRMQMMKTSVSLAFQGVDTRYRVGYVTINSRTNSFNNLAISKFNSTQKSSWFDKLFAAIPNGGTPLRSSLARVGRIYAGQERINTGDEDPVEYSCQQNFVLMTTDGYWNGDDTSNTNNDDVRGLDPYGTTNNSQIGNLDSDSTTRPFYEGPTATYNTLADTTKYLYETDLRDSAWAGYNGTTTADNCLVSGTDDDTGVAYTNRNVCDNNVFVTSGDNNVKQHITTFTLGLGVDGQLRFQDDYQTTTDVTSDYYKVKTGTGSPTGNWPVPASGTETTVDDLWHAAVNGRGRYFSPKDPGELASGLGKALASITARVGAGAAAATSTLNPVSGDNYAYVASYTSVKWIGNLEKRGIDTTTGEVSEKAVWCAENILAGTCTAPSVLSNETVNNSPVTYCVTSGQSTCPGGILVGTSCKVEIPGACAGTLPSKVGLTTDTRTIKVKSGNALVDFDDAFAAANPGYFDASKLANLSQWGALDSTQKAQAVGSGILNYLRGRKGNEDTASNAVADRLFRYREAVLGDLIEAKPNYMGKPKFSYVDPGYAEFVVAKTNRAGTVYAAANDGMLHAFDAANGNELWTYIPTPVLPNLWKLADTAYASNHANFINGSPVVTDICSAYCANQVTDTNPPVWKTILVGGLSGGGRGYYALDVTDPSSPSLLWEYTNADDADLGYTYGNPVVTKKSDGTWVVVFASGYNNSSSGSGRGYLYVLNANSGAQLSKIDTNVGDATTPSGLAKISAWVDNLDRNNTAGYVYGTDLLGNVWRFDINAASAFKFAVLRDALSAVQPITTAPELGLVNGQRVVFVGTGKYLETADLTTTQRQSIYAIKDDGATSTLDTPRTGTGANAFVVQTLTVSSTDAAVRVASTNPVDWSNQRGWYIDLPAAKTDEGSERVNVGMDLISGILAVPTTVPANSVCTPGGYGWFNYLDYKTGGALDPASPNNARASNLVSNVIVGVNVLFINGKPVFRLVTANNPTPQKFGEDPPTSGGGSGFQNKRAVWRELVQ